MAACEDRTVAILGGHGRMGLAVARLLLQETNVRVRLLGRRPALLDGAAAELRSRSSPGRVEACIADAGDAERLAMAVRGVDLLVVSKAGAGHTADIARAVLMAGADCIDLRYPQSVAQEWRKRESELREAGRCVMIQGGHLPGLPGIFLRHAHARNPLLRNVVMATAICPAQPLSKGAADEMLDELRDGRPGCFVGGRWVRSARWRVRPVAFGAGFGRRLCLPLPLDELREMPDEMRLEELNFLVAGFNGFVNGVVAPLAMTLGRLRHRAVRQGLSSLLARGSRRFARPPYGAVMQIEARGDASAPFRMLAHHGDSYFFAAAAAIAGLNQYFDGTLAGRGLWSMSRAANPARLIRDMMRMGVFVEGLETGNTAAAGEQD